MFALKFLITFISLSGLVIRRRKKYLNPKYQINVLKHHFIIFFTLFATYVTCFINIVLLFQQQWWSSSSSSFLFNTSSAKVPKSSSSSSFSTDQLMAILSLLSWSTLLLQVTVQTYLLRLQGKKLVDMSHIFALLVTANLSLWIVDVSSALEATTTSSTAVQQFTSNSTSSASSGSSVSSLPITTTTSPPTAIHRILTMFVTLNRYYCALIFVHFWKMRI